MGLHSVMIFSEDSLSCVRYPRPEHNSSSQDHVTSGSRDPESELYGLQDAFHSGRSTTKQIMTLHFFLDAARTQKLSLTVVFADYRKEFDSMDRRAFLSSSGTSVFQTRFSRM